MKRIYNKPQIVFESFQLTESIAAACADPTGTPTAGTCGVSFGKLVLFWSSMEGICNYPVEEETESWNGICYHVPTDDTRMFNSN